MIKAWEALRALAERAAIQARLSFFNQRDSERHATVRLNRGDLHGWTDPG
jgi:hypothetical protein